MKTNFNIQNLKIKFLDPFIWLKILGVYSIIIIIGAWYFNFEINKQANLCDSYYKEKGIVADEIYIKENWICEIKYNTNKKYDKIKISEIDINN